MKESIKEARLLAKLMKLSPSITENMLKEVTETSEILANQAESVLAYHAAGGKGWRTVTCKECKSKFGTDYGHIAYCSNTCRAKALRDIGIEWNPHLSESDRWGWTGQVPQLVPPQALQTLDTISQATAELLASLHP